MWSTAPNTPLTGHKSLAEPSSTNNINSVSSYEKAILSSDALWEWNTAGNEAREEAIAEPNHKLPEHISSPSKKPVMSESPKVLRNNGLENVPRGVGVVKSDDSKVKVGFFPTTTPLDTTNPAELPGSRIPVITKPPESKGTGERPRAKSIGEANSKLGSYAPDMPKNSAVSGDGLIDASACLGLASYLSSSAPEDKFSLDSGKGSSLAKKPERKTSITPSTISIQGSSADLGSVEDKGISEEAYAELTKSGLCYDFIPSSTKIVVFDIKLRVKKAFFALVANGIRAAPLWDGDAQTFVGMLTITDFINILRHHYRSPIVGMDELENQTIQEWRNFEKKVVSIKSSLIQIGPEESLYEGIRMLVEHKIHRLPVIDPITGNALYILTHKRILEILMQKIPEEAQPQYMFKSLEELGLGTYQNIATASPDTPIISALNIFHEKRVSALPIVDSTNKVVDIYAKFDVINLAAERTYNNLDVNLRDALQHRSQGFEGVHTCYLWESLYTIVQRLISTKVHRLVIVDSKHCVVGVVSLSDILKFLVMKSHT